MPIIAMPALRDQELHLVAGRAELAGHLTVPEDPHGMVVFAHGSGSSRQARGTATSPACSPLRGPARRPGSANMPDLASSRDR